MKAFTLIELTIYVAIIGVVSVLMLGFLWNIIFGNIRATSIQEVQENARFALTRITQEIKKATRINNPPTSGSDNFLELEMAAPHLNPTRFYLEDGKLKISRGTSSPAELTNNQVKVSNLIFRNLSYEDTPGAVQIEITIEKIDSLTLKSTVSLIAGGAAPSPPYLSQLHYQWRNDDGGE